ncbi:MAG: T9SS type A sorting domain-containing protein, partial [Ignavibacteriae bacterium]|nr:T9SS type A sorting domain-containing protein [Ignavibacteriota bacterium]
PDATANFGNFAYGIIEYEATNDLEGNGIKNPGDLTALPSGVFVPFEVYKDGVRIDSAVIGSLTTSKTYTLLDVGEYVFIQLEVASGWKVTNGTGNDTVVISSSGINALVTQLHFKYPSVSGTKFNDLDGDGTKDAGEPGIEGWTINVSGATPSGGTVLTDANGAYTVFVDSGNHTVTEGTVAGWSRTTPVSGSYTFLALSGTVPGANKVNQNFGNFQNYSVGGTVYRDYNGDGIVNGSDAPMSAEVTFGASSSTGSTFTFSDVSFGAKTLAVTIPSGFVCTSPAGGNYAIPGASGMNLTGKDFLLFQSSDGSILYRTFTLDSLQAHMSKKAVARKLPNIPNLVNMLAEIFKQAKDSSLATGIIVGEAGNLLDPANAKSKEKGYVKPAKEGDVMGSLYKKGKTGALYQTGTARGLDFLVKNEARILKLNKSLGPDKHSNVLFGNLMTLAVNIASADFEKTPAGFGDLKYVGPYEAWDGMTPRQILAAANDKMSNWEFVPASTFSDMNTAVAAINAEFSSATLDSASFIVGGKLSWTGVKPVSQSNLFVANPGAAPYQRPYEEHPPTPTAFSLNQNYPNPFNPTTTISFELAEPAIVTVKVFNMLGQEVATVLDREEFFDGVYSEAFDASGLTSGVYFYQIITDVTNEETGASQHFTQTKKMLLAK